MSWVKIDDLFPEHPKLLTVGLAGQGLQVAALCYCSRQLTDGFIPTAALQRLTSMSAKASEQWADRMVAAGLWEEMANGWQIHDYLLYQMSREDMANLKQERSKAGSKGAAKRWQTNGRSPLALAIDPLKGVTSRYFARKPSRPIDALLGSR